MRSVPVNTLLRLESNGCGSRRAKIVLDGKMRCIVCKVNGGELYNRRAQPLLYQSRAARAILSSPDNGTSKIGLPIEKKLGIHLLPPIISLIDHPGIEI